MSTVTMQPDSSTAQCSGVLSPGPFSSQPQPDSFIVLGPDLSADDFEGIQFASTNEKSDVPDMPEHLPVQTSTVDQPTLPGSTVYLPVVPCFDSDGNCFLTLPSSSSDQASDVRDRQVVSISTVSDSSQDGGAQAQQIQSRVMNQAQIDLRNLFVQQADGSTVRLEDVLASSTDGSNQLSAELPGQSNTNHVIIVDDDGTKRIVPRSEFDQHPAEISDKFKQKHQRLFPQAVRSTAAESLVVTYRCTSCNYLSQSAESMRRHRKTHAKRYICTTCGRHFAAERHLRDHVNIHLNIKPHICSECNTSFRTPSDLKRHVRYRHSKEKPHECHLCDYKAIELSKLKRHIRVHNNDRPFRCSEPGCNFSSVDSTKLRLHSSVHSESRDFECTYCLMRFKTAQTLRGHQKTHERAVSDRRVHACAYCDYKATRSADLPKHISRMHRSNVPVRCYECTYSFPDNFHLLKHRRQFHTGKTRRTWSFMCSQCDRIFRSARQFRAHKMSHAPFLSRLQCEECSRTFISRAGLALHVRTQHDQKSTIHFVDYDELPCDEKLTRCHVCRIAFECQPDHDKHVCQEEESRDADPEAAAGTSAETSTTDTKVIGLTQNELFVEVDCVEETDSDFDASAAALNADEFESERKIPNLPGIQIPSHLSLTHVHVRRFCEQSCTDWLEVDEKPGCSLAFLYPVKQEVVLKEVMEEDEDYEDDDDIEEVEAESSI